MSPRTSTSGRPFQPIWRLTASAAGVNVPVTTTAFPLILSISDGQHMASVFGVLGDGIKMVQALNLQAVAELAFYAGGELGRTGDLLSNPFAAWSRRKHTTPFEP